MKIFELLNESKIEVVGDFDQLFERGLVNREIYDQKQDVIPWFKNQIPLWKNKLAKSPVDFKIIFDFEIDHGTGKRSQASLEKKYQSMMAGNNICIVIVFEYIDHDLPLSVITQAFTQPESLAQWADKGYTLWLLMHDIGEVIIQRLMYYGNSVFVENINSILLEFVKRNYSGNYNSIKTMKNAEDRRALSTIILGPMLTMQSARNFRANGSPYSLGFNDSLVEMFVQIILTGSLKLDDPEKIFKSPNYREVFHLDNNYHSSEETRKLEQQLQQCIISHILENNTTPIVVQFGQ
jgi:hypothetical protein